MDSQLTPNEKAVIDKALWELMTSQKYNNRPGARHTIKTIHDIAEKLGLEMILQLYYELDYDKIGD